MRLTVNGQQFDVAEGSNLAALCALLQISPVTCVAEVNGQVLPAGSQQYALAEGDVLELVTIVGGG
jgi:sulfur carrier protein